MGRGPDYTICMTALPRVIGWSALNRKRVKLDAVLWDKCRAYERSKTRTDGFLFYVAV